LGGEPCSSIDVLLVEIGIKNREKEKGMKSFALYFSSFL
jgi:hypothetical protein